MKRVKCVDAKSEFGLEYIDRIEEGHVYEVLMSDGDCFLLKGARGWFDKARFIDIPEKREEPVRKPIEDIPAPSKEEKGMEYEWKQVVYINNKDHPSHGREAVVVLMDTDGFCAVAMKGESTLRHFAPSELSPTPPKRKVKKTVWVGIDDMVCETPGKYMTTAAYINQDFLGDKNKYKYGIHAIEIEMEEA